MYEFGFKSDTGKLRENNQDAFFVIPESGIFLIADGVGGQSRGEIASRTTMQDIAEFVRKNPIPENANDDAILDYFLSIVTGVNTHVHEISVDNTPKGMATTLLMLYVRDNTAYIINVGDSRAYLLRGGDIIQVTEDHTFVNDLVKKGIITELQAKHHPDRNMITRAIGAETTVVPDFYMFQIYPKDVILMCTDGLYNEVERKDIREAVLNAQNMRHACSELIDAANDNGGSDNITVVCVRF